MIQESLFSLLSFIVGSCLGSFCNVLIYRLPRDLSIILPSSFCPECRKALKPYDNIPILSYLILKGRCRFCKKRIPFRYPLVEFLSGLFSLYLYMRFGLGLGYFVYLYFILTLIVITSIDLSFRIIPDILSFAGIGVVLILIGIGFFPPIRSLLGILLGGGTFFLVSRIYCLLRGKEGLGGGDIKLLAMIGGFLGPKGVFFVIFFSSLLGSIFGIYLLGIKKVERSYPIPFGPFLSLGAIVFILGGSYLLDLYFRLLFVR